MCGILAWVGAQAERAPIENLRVALMRMRPRGPDDEGLWQEGGIALGHRRLAILDLEHRAAQPMRSGCGRYLITFNGEIYNFRELRRGLERQGTVFRTTSDTEVIVELFAAEGESMLPKLHGMFAFVIWDRITRRAFAARDPYGIKPLYVATTAEGLMLASQVKALMVTGLVSREPDPRGQAGFWMLGSVPEPYTWYRDIRALRAGHCAWIQDGHMADSLCWSDIGSTWREAPGLVMSAHEVRAEVRAALLESVSRHLVADVPVGVFLSGGIDSGALAGLMTESGTQDIEGVTIAYDEFRGSHEDEAPGAAAIAARYGVRHYVRRVTRDEFLRDLEQIVHDMDQPSIDGINTWYASKAVAERGLKVVISGVGGDELFQGYESFRQLPRLVARWQLLSRVPGANCLAHAVAGLQARRSGNGRWAHAPEWMSTIAGAWWLRRSLYAPEDLPSLMGKELADRGLDAFEASGWVETMSGSLPLNGPLALGLVESTTYLRNQLLRDSDWASMAHSIELRTPLVDSHLLESLRSLLPSFSQHPHKRLLAEAPGLPLPRGVVARRKTGFGIPLDRWFIAEPRAAGQGLVSRAWSQRLVQLYSAGLA